MGRVKDYWHLVEYTKLLEIYQKYVNLAISSLISPKEALDKIASEQQKILNNIKQWAPIVQRTVADQPHMPTALRLLREAIEQLEEATPIRAATV